MDQGNKRTLIQVTLFVVTFSAAFLATKIIFGGKSKDKLAIEQKIDRLNHKLPKMQVDGFLRADKISLIDGDTLQYQYTLVGVNENSPKTVLDAMKQDYQYKSQYYFDNSEEMKLFRDRNIIIKYAYNGKHGKPLFHFVVKSNKKE